MSQKKRVMHIHFGIKGGAERFLVNLVNGLAEKGVEQLVVCLPDRVWRHEIENVAEIYETRISRSHIKRLITNLKIAQLIRRFRPQAILGWMPQAARWIPRRPDILTAARLGDYPKWLDPFENCDYLICNTPDIVEKAVKIGWPAEQARMISNFTMWEQCPPMARADLDTPDDAFVIVGLGRFVQHKGFETLVRAAARLDNAYLWLLGDGEDQEKLRLLAQSLGLSDRLRLPGWVEAPAPYLMAADTFCIPSAHEPLGNVVLEAWALDCPIVSTMSEGPSWLIDDAKTGLLVPIGDDEAMANAFNRIKTDRRFGEKMTKAGYEKLKLEFDRPIIVERYMDFLFQNPKNL